MSSRRHLVISEARSRDSGRPIKTHAATLMSMSTVDIATCIISMRVSALLMEYMCRWSWRISTSCIEIIIMEALSSILSWLNPLAPLYDALAEKFNFPVDQVCATQCPPAAGYAQS